MKTGCTGKIARWGKTKKIAVSVFGAVSLLLNIFGTGKGSSGSISVVRESIRRFRFLEDTRHFAPAQTWLAPIGKILREKLPSGSPLAIAVPDVEKIDAADRAIFQMASYERFPDRVGTVSEADASRVQGFLLASHGDLAPDENEPEWVLLATTPYHYLFAVDGCRTSPRYCDSAFKQKKEHTSNSPARETAGLLVIVGIMTLGYAVSGAAGMTIAVLSFVCSVFIWNVLRIPVDFCSRILILPFGILSFVALGRAWGMRFDLAAKRMRLGKIPVSRTGVTSPKWRKTFFFIAAFALVAAFATLSHTFSAPNGFATNGGRAKVWLLSGGLEKSFFTDSAAGFFQSFYPPGVALLTEGVWMLSGGIGEWITQLIGTIPFVATFAVVLAGCRTRLGKWTALILFSSPIPWKMATLFYSEGWLLLFLVVGIREISAENRVPGWGIVGAAGVFKSEGILLSFSLLASAAFFGKIRLRDFLPFTCGVSFPFAWFAFVFCMGDDFSGYSMSFNAGNATKAVTEMARLAFWEPWQYGWSAFFPFFCFWQKRHHGEKSRLHRFFAPSAVFLATSLLLFPVIYAFSSPYDIDWQIRTSLPRLMWGGAVVSLSASTL